jgi:hypothetical protein
VIEDLDLEQLAGAGSFTTRTPQSSAAVFSERNMPWWGKAIYACGFACGFLGILMNFSDGHVAGSWLIGIGITIVVSNAVRLGHLRVW